MLNFPHSPWWFVKYRFYDAEISYLLDNFFFIIKACWLFIRGRFGIYWEDHAVSFFESIYKFVYIYGHICWTYDARFNFLNLWNETDLTVVESFWCVVEFRLQAIFLRNIATILFKILVYISWCCIFFQFWYSNGFVKQVWNSPSSYILRE